MNITAVNNQANQAATSPLNAANEQARQQNANQAQNQQAQEAPTDNFTRSAETERANQLDNRRETPLQENRTAAPEYRPAEENVNRIENRAVAGGAQQQARENANTNANQAPEQAANTGQDNNASRLQREAIARYAEQNQAAARNQNTNRPVMNLYGEA